MECFEHKLISIPDTAGMDLSWGNAEAVIKLVQRIGKREGFGDLLAKGSRAASQQIGKNSSDFLVEVKGLELPMHDPRAYHGMGLAYAVSNRGACHVNSLNMSLFDDYQRKSSQGKAYLNVKSQDLGSIFNSACICIIAGTSFTEEEILKALNYSTGFGYALNELMTAGERIWLLKRGINNLFGVTKANDRLPKHILTPTSEGGAAGSIPDIDMMLEEFYQLRGLDEQGRPQREKLEKLGLADLAEQIQRHKEAQRKKGVTNG
jgi:aldehyde:ferredoxin oxidoreductase